jgi:hypothetical protein
MRSPVKMLKWIKKICKDCISVIRHRLVCKMIIVLLRKIIRSISDIYFDLYILNTIVIIVIFNIKQTLNFNKL